MNTMSGDLERATVNELGKDLQAAVTKAKPGLLDDAVRVAFYLVTMYETEDACGANIAKVMDDTDEANLNEFLNMTMDDKLSDAGKAKLGECSIPGAWFATSGKVDELITETLDVVSDVTLIARQISQ